MKKLILLPLAVLSMISFNSCKKDNPEPEENNKPSVTITSPTGDIYTDNETIPVVITANASDEEGSVAKVKFYVFDNLISEDNTAPYESISMNASASPEGSLRTYKVVAIDNEGATSEASLTLEVIQNQ